MGLLKALYDAIGSSIKIPNNGTKTLKLRLSVGQDAGGTQGVETVRITPGDFTPEDDKDAKKEKDSPKKKDNVKKDNSKQQHKDSTHRTKEFARLNNLRTSPHLSAKCNNNETQGQPLVSAEASAAASAAAVTKSRLSSQKHKELADLVQQNMERNQIKALR